MKMSTPHAPLLVSLPFLVTSKVTSKAGRQLDPENPPPHGSRSGGSKEPHPPKPRAPTASQGGSQPLPLGECKDISSEMPLPSPR